MKSIRNSAFSLLAVLVTIACVQVRADSMATIAITPATGAVTLVPRWGIGGSLTGFQFMAQDLSLGGGATQFYSIKGTPIPAGGDIAAFTIYIAGSGAATNHADIGSKLTPNAYSALTSADPDIGYGAVNFYLIHHKTTGDYFTVIVPSSGTASAVTDLKPMDGPGGPGTLGTSGYFGLTFAAANLSYGLNMFYYLRTDSVTGNTKFGTLDPALLGTSSDKFDLGMSGFNALAFTGTDVGFGTDKMYYLRLDPVTGFTILGMLDPVAGRVSDVANLGSVYSTLTFVPGDVGFGSSEFYTTGAVNTTWQSVSFAAIADRAISAGSFAVSPSASSGLPITLKVVSGSTGAASISGPVAGVFTVTPTAPGVITLQATQVGQLAPIAYEYNMLRQSFTATGTTLLGITTQPISHSAVIGTNTTVSVAAAGTSTLAYQWRKGGADITGNASATTATLTLPNVQTTDAGSYDVVISNASGSILSDSVLLTVVNAAPIITNSPLTAAGTVGTPFSFTITASGSPSSYTASPVPAGLALNGTTGAITGTPTTVGTTSVLLGATNATGTGNATLTITVAAAGVAPIITNSPLTAAGTVGTPFSFTITASGTPSSYTASPLPAGLTLNTTTGAITGTPTAVGTTAVLVGATNATGTGNATVTITVAAVGTAPVIANDPLSVAGTVGTPFGFTITASGAPTSYSANPLPAGLLFNATTGTISGIPTSIGITQVQLGATNATGTGAAMVTITIGAAGIAPIITNYPLTATGIVGRPFSFSITASGAPLSYETSPLPLGLVLNTTTGSITGRPTNVAESAVLLSASNAAGTGHAILMVKVIPAPRSWISVFSARAMCGPGDKVLIVGFYESGGSENFLVRAIGPGMIPYGVPNAIVDPKVTVYGSSGALATNDNWEMGSNGQSDGAAITAASSRVGAFALGSGSKDAALLFTGNEGVPTTCLIEPNTTPGDALAELYDTDNGLGGHITSVSARLEVAGVGFTSTVGMVIAGDAPKTLLIRGVGPTLATFGVSGVIADPVITLFSGNVVTKIASNDNWEVGDTTASQMTDVTAQVGAFPLPSGGKDAALLVTLQPGTYTVQITGVNGATGVVLLEVYVVQ